VLLLLLWCCRRLVWAYTPLQERLAELKVPSFVMCHLSIFDCYHVPQAPGAWAYAPLQERLAELKLPSFVNLICHLLFVLQAPGAWAYAPLQERLAELKVPITFIYAEHDWMHVKGSPPSIVVLLLILCCRRLVRGHAAARAPG
jgi:hypothetical protein